MKVNSWEMNLNRSYDCLECQAMSDDEDVRFFLI